MTAPLQVRGVSTALAGRPVLHDVTFNGPAGSVTALIGPNGAGKTTTVNVATGLRRPDQGVAQVNGRDVRDRGARTAVSLVPQEISFPAAVGVAACIDLVERQRDPSVLVPSRADLCDALGMAPLLGRRVGALSGGQRRRLALVLGLVRAPGVLILDEATTNLDETHRAVTWRLVADYAAAGGAVLVTTHILADIDTHADRVVALSGGRVVLRGALAEVRSRLGGTEVSVQVGDPLRTAAALAGRGHPGTPVGRSGLRWRTPTPLALVATLHEVAPDARDLSVRPVPLNEVLAALTGSGRDAAPDAAGVDAPATPGVERR